MSGSGARARRWCGCSCGVHGGDECTAHFLRVAGTHVEQFWHRAIQACERDWLVGWLVFAGADGVMGSDVDLPQALTGAHTDGCRRVSVGSEEG